MEEEEKRPEYKVSALNTKNNLVEVTIHECLHCRELIPKVDDCPNCGTAYNHMDTVENFETGFLHYIYECSGCPDDERSAQKILKLTEEVTDKRLDMRKNLADDFLRSGGY